MELMIKKPETRAPLEKPTILFDKAYSRLSTLAEKYSENNTAYEEIKQKNKVRNVYPSSQVIYQRLCAINLRIQVHIQALK